MGQLTIFEAYYKYVIDASSILSQKNNEKNRRSVFKQMWENIDELIRQGVIVTSSEIIEEVEDEDLKKWIKDVNLSAINAEDEEIQKNVIIVVRTNTKIINFTQNKSSGDAFLIATAMKYKLTVITEENKEKADKIPRTCSLLGIPCNNILELCEKENWKF